MIRKKLGNTCLESRLAASSRPSSDCELLRRFRQQGWKVSSEIQSLGLSASFESCWDTTAPAFHRHHPHRPTTARLPARFPQPAPRGEEARTGLCPPAAAILTELGGRCRKAPYRTATSTQSCIHRRNPQASGGRAPLKLRLMRPETAVRFEASGKCSLGYNPVA